MALRAPVSDIPVFPSPSFRKQTCSPAVEVIALFVLRYIHEHGHEPYGVARAQRAAQPRHWARHRGEHPPEAKKVGEGASRSGLEDRRARQGNEVTARAIETRYAGCRFRSRLEARWAVVLDTLGVPWEYEAQGFMCDYRLSLSSQDPYPYLPDFWLPREKCFLEVKGSLTREEHLGVMDRAADLCDRTDTRLILAGPIPREGTPPVAMHMRKGCLLASPGLIGGITHDGYYENPDGHRYVDDNACLAHDVGGAWDEVTRERCGPIASTGAHLADPLTQQPWGSGLNYPHLASAYVAARSARFEHGERG